MITTALIFSLSARLTEGTVCPSLPDSGPQCEYWSSGAECSHAFWVMLKSECSHAFRIMLKSECSHAFRNIPKLQSPEAGCVIDGNMAATLNQHHAVPRHRCRYGSQYRAGTSIDRKPGLGGAAYLRCQFHFLVQYSLRSMQVIKAVDLRYIEARRRTKRIFRGSWRRRTKRIFRGSCYPRTKRIFRGSCSRTKSRGMESGLKPPLVTRHMKRVHIRFRIFRQFFFKSAHPRFLFIRSAGGLSSVKTRRSPGTYG